MKYEIDFLAKERFPGILDRDLWQVMKVMGEGERYLVGNFEERARAEECLEILKHTWEYKDE